MKLETTYQALNRLSAETCGASCAYLVQHGMRPKVAGGNAVESLRIHLILQRGKA
jgi:hypothetical protein